MSDEEFYEQFHRKGGDYLIPDRVFEDLLYEKEKLEKKLNELQKPQIFIDTQNIEERYAEGKYQDYLEEQVKKLMQENEELKKELDEMLDENLKLSEIWCDSRAKIRELEEQLEDMTDCRDIASGHRKEVQDRETRLLNQQQEFIRYLEYKISFYKINTQGYSMDIVKEILQKYKEIIEENG